MNKLYGLEKEKAKLLNLLHNDKNSPVLLYSDGYHFGKTTLVRYIIREFMASMQPEENRSSAYRKFDNNNEVDFLYIEIGDKKQLTLDEVNQIRDFMLSKPIQNKFKVVMVDEIQFFNTVSQNSLLKTLEEPPPYVKFIFTTSNDVRLLDTIKSRCILFPVHKTDSDAIEEFLKDNFQDLSQDEKTIILQYANSIYDLHLFTDKELDFNSQRNLVLSYLSEIHQGKMFTLINKHPFDDDYVLIKTDILQKVLFDILYTQLNMKQYIVNQDKIDEIHSLANQTSIQKLMDTLEQVKKYIPYLKVKNIKQDLVLNNLLIKIIQCFK